MRAYACGLNNFCAVGPAANSRDSNSNHLMVPFVDGFTDIQCGSTFSLILDEDGKIQIVGMLNGLLYPRPNHISVRVPMRVIQMACGKKHALLLMEGGYVMSFGTGFFGQLGHGDDFCYNEPRLVESLNPRKIDDEPTLVAAGGSHSAILTKNGQLFLFGLNRSAQCGVSTQDDSVLLPTLLVPIHNAQGYDWGAKSGNGKVIDVVLGKSHSALHTADGNVYCWGGSTHGRLGVQKALPKVQHFPVLVRYFKDNDIKVVKLVSGDYHMLALSDTGNVYSWGYGADGQLGHSSLYHFRAPKMINHFDDKKVHIVEIASGGLYSAAVDDKGALWTWGYGDGGWLGISRTEDDEPPNFESDDPTEFPFIEGHEIISTFMSQMCVIVPRKVTQLVGMLSVKRVACGDAHCVAIGT